MSYVSIVWTVLAGSLDANGSAALVVHFRHARSHDELADHHERRATIIVSSGLMLLETITIIESRRRLASHQFGTSSGVGVTIAAVARFVLGGLSVVKQRVGRELDSAALVGERLPVGVTLLRRSLAD